MTVVEIPMDRITDLLEAAAFVNWRRVSRRSEPLVVLAYYQ